MTKANLIGDGKKIMEDREYGVMMYDIPDKVPAGLGNLLRAKLRPIAVRVNLSVWLVHWGQTEQVERIVQEAHDKYEVPISNILIFKADKSAVEILRAQAVIKLHEFIADIRKSLELQIANMREKDEATLAGRHQRDFLKRLEDLQVLAIAFQMMGDIDVAFDGIRQLVAARITADVWEKLVRKPQYDGMIDVVEGIIRQKGLSAYYAGQPVEAPDQGQLLDLTPNVA